MSDTTLLPSERVVLLALLDQDPLGACTICGDTAYFVLRRASHGKSCSPMAIAAIRTGLDKWDGGRDAAL